eukprot:6211138-Pleurochrysis_carterae.AAC.1
MQGVTQALTRSLWSQHTSKFLRTSTTFTSQAVTEKRARFIWLFTTALAAVFRVGCAICCKCETCPLCVQKLTRKASSAAHKPIITKGFGSSGKGHVHSLCKGAHAVGKCAHASGPWASATHVATSKCNVKCKNHDDTE